MTKDQYDFFQEHTWDWEGPLHPARAKQLVQEEAASAPDVPTKQPSPQEIERAALVLLGAAAANHPGLSPAFRRQMVDALSSNDD